MDAYSLFKKAEKFVALAPEPVGRALFDVIGTATALANIKGV